MHYTIASLGHSSIIALDDSISSQFEYGRFLLPSATLDKEDGGDVKLFSHAHVPRLHQTPSCYSFIFDQLNLN